MYKEYHALIVRNAKEHCRKLPECRGALEDICMHARLTGET